MVFLYLSKSIARDGPSFCFFMQENSKLIGGNEEKYSEEETSERIYYTRHGGENCVGSAAQRQVNLECARSTHSNLRYQQECDDYYRRGVQLAQERRLQLANFILSQEMVPK